MATVLVADDDLDGLETSRIALTTAGHSVVVASSGAQAVSAVSDHDIDVVLTDVDMPGMSGIELCTHVVDHRADIPVIVMTGDGKLETAVAAIRAGAYDFLLKPVPPAALVVAIDRAMRHRSLRRQIRRLHKDASPGTPVSAILGQCEVMRQVLDVIERLADTETSVLVLGAHGTGKQLVARALHDKSRRRAGPLRTVNCATSSESALEAELFGQAETPTRPARSGVLVQARGGTVLLDEIGDLPLSLQPRLLRALQNRAVCPLGATTETPTDVRVLAATTQDLALAVEQRRFRSDLFLRINVVQVVVPPLRARGADILLLADHFLGRFALRAGKDVHGIAAAAAGRLLAYEWPGNVRELEDTMERAVALARHDELSLEDLPETIRTRDEPLAPPAPIDELATMPTLREVTRRHIARVLALTDNNKTLAARVLGIDRKTLYRKLEGDDGLDAMEDQR